MPYSAVQWLDRTFRSQERAEELLRPDLESGLITEHDYRLAVDFLPRKHRYYPYLTSAGTTTAFLLLAKRRRWPITSPGIWLGTFATTFMGMLAGQVIRAKAHFDFARSLEKPTDFAKALQNVNYRTGGKEPLPWTIPGSKRQALPPSPEHPPYEDTQPGEPGWVNEPQVVSDTTPSPPSSTTPYPTPTQRRSKWDEIRDANARATAKQSTWDILREKHERGSLANREPSSSNGTPGDDSSVWDVARYSDDDRAREQARFDALLEIERRTSRS